MTQERSIHRSGQPRRAWIGVGTFTALAAAGALLVRANTPRAPGPRAEERSETVSAGAAPTRGATTIAPPRSLEIHGAHRKSAARAPTRAPTTLAGRPAIEERAQLVAAARRELAQLEAQEPTNFLAIFDMMREERQGSDRTLEDGRRASHAYILARMHILDGMLRRFIDDPDSDGALETEALARLDADFAQTVDTLARDVPAMASIQEILTTTMLKPPTFTDRSSEAQ